MTTPEAQRRFLDCVLETVTRHGLLPLGRRPPAEREPVVVGVSGGPDSIALLDALCRLAEAGRLAVAPVVAHLHHGLRGAEADRDAAHVAETARRLGLPCHLGRADVRAEADRAGLGLEEAGRRARRRFLLETARRAGARRVALGHHADDRVETILFHICRGTGIEGLASLGPRAPLQPETGIEVVRPLMHPDLGRAEVLAYLRSRGIGWREDASNRTADHTRNRIRHQVLPMLEEAVHPAVRKALLRLAHQAEAARAVLEDALETTWRAVVREVPAPATEESRRREPPAEATTGTAAAGGGGPPCPAPGEAEAKSAARRGDRRSPPPTRGEAPARPRAVLIDAEDFARLRPWMQGALLRRAVQRLGGGLKHLSAARTDEAVAALLAKAVAGPVDLPGGLTAERRRGVIRIGPGAGRGRQADGRTDGPPL